MGTIKTLGRAAFRDYVTDGVSSSGANPPSKAEIRAFVDEVDAEVLAIAVQTPATEQVNALSTALEADIGAARAGGPPRWEYDATTGYASRQEKILFVIPSGGQSLAEGSSTGSPIATTAVYPGRALMPADGSGNSCLHPIGNGIGSLIDLVEGETPNGVNMWGSPSETLSSSMINHLIRDVDAVLSGNNLKFATFVFAQGGLGYAGLKAGSQPFFWFTSTLAQIVEIAANIGYRVIVPAVVWRHGETDSSFNADRYRAFMNQFQRDLTSAARSITRQDEDVVLMVDQVGYTIVGQILTGQYMMEAMRKLPDANPNIKFVGPTYQFPRNTSDNIHYTAIGENKAAMQFSRAIRDEIVGPGWRPHEPVEIYFNAAKTAIIVELFVPAEPVVIDTSGDVTATTLNTYGFDVIDPGGAFLTISSVTVVAASTDANTYRRPRLSINLASAVTAPWVRLSYANRRDGVAVGLSIASPAVITLTAHGFAAGTPFILQTSGALPGGVSQAVVYYVIATGLTANTFQFSATLGGSAVATTGSYAATIYLATNGGNGSMDGNVSGARGCIRDSAAQASLYSGSLTGLTSTDNNWLCAFSQRVGG